MNVKENQRVEAGAVLAQMDPRDYEIAMPVPRRTWPGSGLSMAAKAAMPVASSAAGTQITSSEAIAERAKSGVEVANKEFAAAQARLNSAQARVREAQANATKASRDLERMKQLVAKDEVSQQQYDAAVSTAAAAQAAVQSVEAGVLQAQHEIAAAQARTSQSQADCSRRRRRLRAPNRSPANHHYSSSGQSADARVRLAKAALDQARLNLEYTTIKAPVAGIVSKKSVETGQVVQPGQPLMAIVPQEDIWVTANFKETQLADMRPPGHDGH